MILGDFIYLYVQREGKEGLHGGRLFGSLGVHS